MHTLIYSDAENLHGVLNSPETLVSSRFQRFLHFSAFFPKKNSNKKAALERMRLFYLHDRINA